MPTNDRVRARSGVDPGVVERPSRGGDIESYAAFLSAARAGTGRAVEG